MCGCVWHGIMLLLLSLSRVLTLGILMIVYMLYSLKIPELMLELIRYMKYIWLQLGECVKIMWTRGTYDSQCLKGPHEN